MQSMPNVTSLRKAVAKKIRNGLALYFNNVCNRQPIFKTRATQTMETVA